MTCNLVLYDNIIYLYLSVMMITWACWHWDLILEYCKNKMSIRDQFYQFCVQMRLWLISLTISTLSHPTVSWSWCSHPTVLSVWWPNEIVTYFTHFLYTLVSNSFISCVSKWECDSFHSPYLHFHIQLCYEVGVHILLFYQFWWPNVIVTYFTHFLYTLISNCLVLKWYYNSYHSQCECHNMSVYLNKSNC